jgi:hypothetical protein
VLRHGTPDEKVRMFQQFQSEAKNILETCITIAYYMRGGIQYDDLLTRSPVERELFLDFIKERLEIENKKMYPNY